LLGHWACRLPKARMAAFPHPARPCAMITPLNFERQQCNSE
jgi:hypothetical protein